jgi:hypothetical protein
MMGPHHVTIASPSGEPKLPQHDATPMGKSAEKKNILSLQSKNEAYFRLSLTDHTSSQSNSKLIMNGNLQSMLDELCMDLSRSGG